MFSARAVVCKPGCEIPGLIGQLSAAAAPCVEGAVVPLDRRRRLRLRRLVLLAEHLPREGASVFREDLQRAVGVRDKAAVVEQIDRADQNEQDKEDCGDRSHDEFFPQLVDHDLTSR